MSRVYKSGGTGYARSIRVSGLTTDEPDPGGDINGLDALLAYVLKVGAQASAWFTPILEGFRAAAIPPSPDEFLAAFPSESEPFLDKFTAAFAFFYHPEVTGDINISHPYIDQGYALTTDRAYLNIEVEQNVVFGEKFYLQESSSNLGSYVDNPVEFIIVRMQPKSVMRYRFDFTKRDYVLVDDKAHELLAFHESVVVTAPVGVVFPASCWSRVCDNEGPDETLSDNFDKYLAHCKLYALTSLADYVFESLKDQARLYMSGFSGLQAPVLIRNRLVDVFLANQVYLLRRQALVIEERFQPPVEIEIMSPPRFAIGVVPVPIEITGTDVAQNDNELGFAKFDIARGSTLTGNTRVEWETIHTFEGSCNLICDKVDRDTFKIVLQTSGNIICKTVVTYVIPTAPVAFGSGGPLTLKINDLDGNSDLQTAEADVIVNGPSTNFSYEFNTTTPYTEEVGSSFSISRDVSYDLGGLTLGFLYIELSQTAVLNTVSARDTGAPGEPTMLFSGKTPQLELTYVPPRKFTYSSADELSEVTLAMSVLSLQIDTISIEVDVYSLEQRLEHISSIWQTSFLGGLGQAALTASMFAKTMKMSFMLSGVGTTLSIFDDFLKGLYGQGVAEFLGLLLSFGAVRYQRSTNKDVDDVIGVTASVMGEKKFLSELVEARNPLTRPPYKPTHGEFRQRPADVDYVAINSSGILGSKLSEAAGEYIRNSDSAFARTLKRRKNIPEHHNVTVNSNFVSEGKQYNMRLLIGISDGANSHNGTFGLGSSAVKGTIAQPGMMAQLSERLPEGQMQPYTFGYLGVSNEELVAEKGALMIMDGWDPKRVYGLDMDQLNALTKKTSESLAKSVQAKLMCRDRTEIKASQTYYDLSTLVGLTSSLTSKSMKDSYGYSLLNKNCQHFAEDIYSTLTIPGRDKLNTVPGFELTLGKSRGNMPITAEYIRQTMFKVYQSIVNLGKLE